MLLPDREGDYIYIHTYVYICIYMGNRRRWQAGTRRLLCARKQMRPTITELNYSLLNRRRWQAGTRRSLS
jgi:hypothetical protein